MSLLRLDGTDHPDIQCASSGPDTSRALIKASERTDPLNPGLQSRQVAANSLADDFNVDRVVACDTRFRRVYMTRQGMPLCCAAKSEKLRVTLPDDSPITSMLQMTPS